MDPKLQTRVQRYGWDLASDEYEGLWQQQLASARVAMFAAASLAEGERVLDVACGTGLLTREAARLVGPTGHVTGVDLSGKMIEAARRRTQSAAPVDTSNNCATAAAGAGVGAPAPNTSFHRMDAQQLDLPPSTFDAVLCGLGLMYVPDPSAALREMQRVLRPNGRVVIAVWGDRTHCGWSPLFEIVQAEVASEVCPLFFNLGDQLAALCIKSGLDVFANQRIHSTLNYTDAQQACDAAFVGGPVALAWSRFEAPVKRRVSQNYLRAIDPYRQDTAYSIPGEFVIVGATKIAIPR